jgi:hypothetical protein
MEIENALKQSVRKYKYALSLGPWERTDQIKVVFILWAVDQKIHVH